MEVNLGTETNSLAKLKAAKPEDNTTCIPAIDTLKTILEKTERRVVTKNKRMTRSYGYKGADAIT